MLKKIRSRKIFKTAVVIAIFVFLIILNPLGFFNGIRGAVFGAVYPFQKIFSVSAEKIHSFGSSISSIGKYKQENESLIRENLRLRAETANLKDVAKENDELRKQLEILPKEKFDMISSNIIGRDLHKESNYFVIDKGSKDGIKEGMPAIVNEGILIGKIEEVFYTHSKVLLVTSPNSNINAVTLETGSIGVVSGKYGLGMILDMVLQTDYLKIGDDVITSEISQNIPRGLLIGKIKEVYPSGGYLFQQAVISSPVDFSKMRFVFVIRNEK